MSRLFVCGLALLAAVVTMPPAAAETVQRSGPYTVHYSAIVSTDLTPEVARQYAITRSANRGLLNIAVRRHDGEDAELGLAVAAQVSGSATNDVGQRQELRFREVREGTAIYYLAEPRIRSGDPLNFALEVVPDGGAVIAVRFSQVFFDRP